MQRVKVTPYKITYQETDLCNDIYVQYCKSYEEFLYEISRRAVFSDLDDGFEVIDREAKGVHYEYCGWMPGMEVRFVNRDNPEEILWDAFYPEWEH